MNNEVRKLAFKQYLHYFRIWFVLTGISVVVLLVAVVPKLMPKNSAIQRGNTMSTEKERVFDYADVLTDEEEQKLREYIAECEQKSQTDIIVVTLDQPMIYGLPDSASQVEEDEMWNHNMMNFADDFYDEHQFGWNQPYGDGALILDNWYEDENGSQKGTWLSTAGKMEEYIGIYEEDVVLDAMYDYIDYAPYRAYYAAVTKLADYGEHGYERNYSLSEIYSIVACGGGAIPLIIALIYALTNLKNVPAKDTTKANTYVVNGKVIVNSRMDEFLRKNVTKRHIDTSSSSGGGGSSRSHHSGGGSHGHHTSSSGHSHGGGGRRR